jgi:isoleucyl-tRNA synthetase
MHKSWGNAIEFNEAADNMGVDVMRWLYCAHKPENDLLFGYNRGDEARRRFLIPLWNVYSFFATYARLDGWEPALTPSLPLSPEGERGKGGEGVFTPATPEGPTPRSENLLDQWIVARLNQVVERTTEALEASDSYSATLALDTLLDDLSNWYVRRSRRRFWKSEHDQDKDAAYATLYHVLVKLIKLLGPFIPFMTETIYQNLVRAVQPDAYESVHHTAWPQADPSTVDEPLLEQMALARQVASLGLSARNGAGLKVRQPLAKVMVYAGDAARRTLRDELVDIVTDELNVKAFEFVEDARQLVTYRILPDNKLLGPKFGARFPALRNALAAADPYKVAGSVAAGLPLSLEVDGEMVELAPEEILVSTQPAAGLAVAADKLATVAVDATVTPELRLEGLAREVVRRVQAMRKDAGFDIADRISTYYVASGELAQVFSAWGDYVKAETLTTNLVAAPPPEGAYTETHKLEGEELVVGVKRN